jgi:hypothetical protein
MRDRIRKFLAANVNLVLKHTVDECLLVCEKAG